ncbi:MAG: Cysteine desulfurase SufS [Phycisphaerae bacterium]|nr:Cysteine desulfurase SufS [Phycisphaerae bacterium]
MSRTGSTIRTATPAAAAPLDVQRVRRDFPILAQSVHGKPLVYLDSAATSHKPQCVIDAVSRVYSEFNSNVHRGVHALSQRATDAYEAARGKVRDFINAADSAEVIFVRGTTEAINLAASSFARPRVKAGDEILITHMEHHSNIVPWQLLCEQTGAALRVAPIDDRGQLILEEWERLLSDRTKLVGVTYVSNALGTVNPVARMIRLAHERGVPVLIDGAQATPHIPIDVQALGCDFFAFSGHKTYGPTGIGVLYGRREHLEAMPPYQGGGDMISSVTFARTTYNDLPYKFEAGTPNIADAIGLGAAIDYLRGLGMDRVAAHEADVLAYGQARLAETPGIRPVGTADHKAGVLSFAMEGIHAHDVGTILDLEGIAIRTGHHCAQPVMERFGVPATARASLGVYNSREDIDALIAALGRVAEVFK